jgi:hypothetical protein
MRTPAHANTPQGAAMTNLRGNGPTLLLTLIAATVAACLILRSMGSTPGVEGAVVQAITARVAPQELLPDDVSIGQLTDEHRALEVAQLVASSVPRLKALYLECVRSTSEHRMDVDEAVYCQAVADTLMNRHFNGSLEELLSWWRAQPSPTRVLDMAKGT